MNENSESQATPHPTPRRRSNLAGDLMRFLFPFNRSNARFYGYLLLITICAGILRNQWDQIPSPLAIGGAVAVVGMIAALVVPWPEIKSRAKRKE